MTGIVELYSLLNTEHTASSRLCAHHWRQSVEGAVTALATEGKGGWKGVELMGRGIRK